MKSYNKEVISALLAMVLFSLLTYTSMAYVNSKYAESSSRINLNDHKIQGLREIVNEIKSDVKKLLQRRP